MDGNELSEPEDEVGYGKAFTDNRYARASIVGCLMSMF
jgi:hypothetical protein